SRVEHDEAAVVGAATTRRREERLVDAAPEEARAAAGQRRRRGELLGARDEGEGAAALMRGEPRPHALLDETLETERAEAEPRQRPRGVMPGVFGRVGVDRVDERAAGAERGARVGEERVRRVDDVVAPKRARHARVP